MEELLKNDIVELNVTNLGSEGEGVARAGGKTVFIRGALKGERIRAKIIAVKPRFDVALLEKVLVPSPDRIAPDCPLFNKCGGCDLMHLSYEAELKFKRALVEETFYKVGGITVTADEVVPSPEPLRYRNKLSLPVRSVRGETKIGLFAKNSHRIVETNDCLLQYEWNAPLIAALKEFLRSSGYKGYDEETGKGEIRHLVARLVGSKLCVTVVATKDIDCSAFGEKLKNICSDCELWLNINTRRDNVILGREWKRIFGSDGETVIEGLKTEIHPAGFFQVNDSIRELLYSYVADMCSGGAAVEAYSGAGLLSARLSRKAKTVFGIEINEQAHAAALKLKTDNNLTNFFPILGDVSDKLPAVLDKCSALSPDTFIVLDPPRAGISESAANTLASSGATNIVYISCNPATLSRDAKRLTDGGYSITSVKPFDMFPRTANVETVVKFTKQEKLR